MTHYVCKLHAKYVNEFIVKLHCFIVLSWQGITNEVTAFQKCVVFSNFPFFSTVLLHKSEGCESKVKGCESISRYGKARYFFLDLKAGSHGVKTHQKASFETKNGQISSTPELPLGDRVQSG